jgi:hypothetical protein
MSATRLIEARKTAVDASMFDGIPMQALIRESLQTCIKFECGEGALRSCKQAADTAKNSGRGKLFQDLPTI